MDLSPWNIYDLKINLWCLLRGVMCWRQRAYCLNLVWFFPLPELRYDVIYLLVLLTSSLRQFDFLKLLELVNLEIFCRLASKVAVSLIRLLMFWIGYIKHGGEPSLPTMARIVLSKKYLSSSGMYPRRFQVTQVQANLVFQVSFPGWIVKGMTNDPRKSCPVSILFHKQL